jgi:ribosomal protein S17E
MKTAVSQMIKEFQEQFPKEMRDMYERNQLLIEDIGLRAKEIFKQQIIDAYETSHISMMTSKQYYNETFKTDKG